MSEEVTLDAAMLAAIEVYCSTKPGETTRHKQGGDMTIIHKLKLPGFPMGLLLQFGVINGLVIVNGRIPIKILREQAGHMYQLIQDMYAGDSVFYGRIEIDDEDALNYRLFQYYPSKMDTSAWLDFVSNVYKSATTDMGRFIATTMTKPGSRTYPAHEMHPGGTVH